MGINRLTVIVPLELVERIEGKLRDEGVPGMSVEHVRGYGKHRNLFRQDRMRDNARLVIYANSERTDGLVKLVADTTQAIGADLGILAVETIDRLVNLNDGKDIDAAEL